MIDAFATNTESLTLEERVETRIVERILDKLHNHPCLCKLRLDCGTEASADHIDDIGSLLRGSVSLCELHFGDYEFLVQDMEIVTIGLLSKPTLRKLAFRSCLIKPPVMNRLVRCMQSEREQYALCELELHTYVNEVGFVSSILTTVQAGPASIGSSLQHLTLQSGACHRVWEFLSNSGAMVQLPTMTMV
jgi:hypothetical protein